MTGWIARTVADSPKNRDHSDHVTNSESRDCQIIIRHCSKMTAWQKRATGKCVFENKPERNMELSIIGTILGNYWTSNSSLDFKGETDIICTNLKKQENERAPSDWLIFRSSDWLLQCHKMTLTCRERESINKLGITVNRRVYLVILIIMIHIYDS